MANLITIATVIFLLIFKTQSQYYKDELNQNKGKGKCELDRTYLSGNKVLMIDGVLIQGMKVKFKSDCALKEVDEYLGIQYADLSSYYRKSLRYVPNKGRGRSITSTIKNDRYATQHKPVCPQMHMDKALKLQKGMPEKLRDKLSKIGNFTRRQSDGCLWLNMVVPEKGKD